MEESKERLFFIDEIRKALKADHNDRNSLGLEPKRFVRGAFEKAVEKSYPQVGTSELLNTARKGAIKVKSDPTSKWGMNFDKVDGLLNYIFKQNDATKWPRVVKLVKTYSNGKYAHYAEKVKTEEESEIDAIMSSLNGSNKPTHLKLLRLYVEETIKYHEKSEENMANDKIVISKMEKRAIKLEKAIQSIVHRLQGNPNLTKEEVYQIEEARKMLE